MIAALLRSLGAALGRRNTAAPWPLGEHYYRHAKAVRQGSLDLPVHHARLADWIAQRYDVAPPMDFFFERVAPHDMPRLMVSFEHESDFAGFYDPIGNYDDAMQAEIAAQFLSLLPPHERATIGTDSVFVAFSGFDQHAREEANHRLASGGAGRSRLEAMRVALGPHKLWKIYPELAGVVFFHWTDAQLDGHGEADFRRRCEAIYAQTLNRFDEFGYYRDRPVAVEFSSRETFKARFEGNWGYFAHR